MGGGGWEVGQSENDGLSKTGRKVLIFPPFGCVQKQQMEVEKEVKK